MDLGVMHMTNSMVINLPNAAMCSESQGSKYLTICYHFRMWIVFQEVNLFVCRLTIHECNPEKCHKILDLELSEDEWERVQLLLLLLGVK